MHQMKSRIFQISAYLIIASNVHATHIKGGHIAYRQIGANTYEFTFTGFRDVDGVLFGNGIFDFGDGTVIGGTDGEALPWETPIRINESTELWRFSVIHTYGNSGSYVTSYTEDFRNESVVNYKESLSKSFYVEARVINDPLLGFNSSPSFSNPDFIGVVGQTFLTSFFTNDPDEDSLSFKVIIPKQANDLEVGGYRFPDNTDFYDDGGSKYFISSRNGNLVWDTKNLNVIPVMESREFNIAIMIEQWRDGFLVGSNTIDYNLEVWNLGNDETISIAFPSTKCYSSDEIITDTILIENPSFSQIDATFNSDDLAYTINELSPEDWNSQILSNPLNAEENELIIEFNPTSIQSEATYSSLQMILEFMVGDNPEVGIT